MAAGPDQTVVGDVQGAAAAGATARPFGVGGEEVLRQGSRFGPQDDLHELGEEVGSGAAARVYTCRRLNTGERLAAKVINLQKLRLLGDLEAHMVKLDREVSILRELQHPRLVRLHSVHKTTNWLFLVMELVCGGELFDQIVQNRSLNEVEAKYIFRQLLEGVGYMHSKRVIHRDLKPENILIASTRQADPPLSGKLHDVKIADFGLSKVINEGTSFAKTFVGTPQYWAPEVLAVQGGGGTYTQAADYWSLGAVLFVMLCGRYPFDGKKMPLEEQIRTATFSMTSAAWQKISGDAKDLVRGLLRVQPSERLGLEECLRHPWFGDAIVAPLPLLQAPPRPSPAELPTAFGPIVTEVFNEKTPAAGYGPVPMVTQPSTASDISGGSTSRVDSRTASQGGQPNRRSADGSTSPPSHSKQRTEDVPSIRLGASAMECTDPLGCASSDQETIFCLNELLKLQVSIAGSLEMACLAFRHADTDLAEMIRATFRQARDLSSFAANVISQYAQVAQQVSQFVLPDLKLAVQEKEPSLAVSLLGMVKGWVANMKKDGEEIQRRYHGLQESVHQLIQRAQSTKTDADRRLAEAVQVAEAELGPASASPRSAQQFLAIEPPLLQMHGVGSPAEGATGAQSTSTSPGRTDSNDAAMGGSGAVSFGPSANGTVGGGGRPQDVEVVKQHSLNVPFSMNLWTRQLFEQLSAAQEGTGAKAIEDKKDDNNDGGDVPMGGTAGPSAAGGSTVDGEVWKRDVLDLLFMAPGIFPTSLPKVEPFSGFTELGYAMHGTDAAGSGDSDVAMDRGTTPGGSAVMEDSLVRYTPTNAAVSAAEAVAHSSASLLRALRELKRVDEILQGCSSFWSNMDSTVQKLSQMKEHTECLVNYAANSKPLRERFEQRLGEYVAFWNSLERLCRQYVVDHQASSKRMYEVIREVSDVTDVIDTAQSARMAMALALREKQRRHGYPMA